MQVVCYFFFIVKIKNLLCTKEAVVYKFKYVYVQISYFCRKCLWIDDAILTYINVIFPEKKFL